MIQNLRIKIVMKGNGPKRKRKDGSFKNRFLSSDLLDDQDDPTKRQRLLPMDFDEESPTNQFDDTLSPLPAAFLQYMIYYFARLYDINAREEVEIDLVTGITTFKDVEEIYDFSTWYLANGETFLTTWKAQEAVDGQEEENTWAFITKAPTLDQLKKSTNFYDLMVIIFQAGLPTKKEQADAIEELTGYATLQVLIDEVKGMRAAFGTKDIGMPYVTQFGTWLSSDPEEDGKTVLDILVERWNLMFKAGLIAPSQIFQERPKERMEEEPGDVSHIPQDFSDFINQGNFFFSPNLKLIFWKESTKVKRIQPPRSKVQEPSEQVETWISVRFDPPTKISRERLIALSFSYPSFLIKSSSS